MVYAGDETASASHPADNIVPRTVYRVACDCQDTAELTRAQRCQLHLRLLDESPQQMVEWSGTNLGEHKSTICQGLPRTLVSTSGCVRFEAMLPLMSHPRVHTMGNNSWSLGLPHPTIKPDQCMGNRERMDFVYIGRLMIAIDESSSGTCSIV